MAQRKLKVLCVGKSREAWLKECLAHYGQRLAPYLRLEWVEVDDELPLRKAAIEGAIGLDPRGRQLTSEQFSTWLYKELESQQEVTFLIGGPDGFSSELRSLLSPARCLSLSALTMTHQVVRMMLAEQLYRAALIHIGHPYHRS
jgi:23S rRNA (pseudouridine1915-N3)-methyltransferase